MMTMRVLALLVAGAALSCAQGSVSSVDGGAPPPARSPGGQGGPEFAPHAPLPTPPASTPPNPSAAELGHHKLAAYAPGTDAMTYAAGAAATVTVPAGVYVTGLSCHATGGGATLTITPSGPSITSPTAGPSIPIPAGGGFSLGRPWLASNANELGAGTVLVFAGTDSYFVGYYALGGP